MAKDRPGFRYNNTKPELITKTDNKALTAVELKAAIEAFKKRVGLKAKP